MFIKTVIVLVHLVSVLSAELNSDCVTPNDEKAKCIPIKSCAVIISAIETRNDTAKKFAKDSQCGLWSNGTGGRVPLVCCGSTGYPKPTLDEIYGLFNTEQDDVKPVTTEKPTTPQPPLEDYDTKSLPDRTICGMDNSGNRIWGGEETSLDEFPWMVALEFKKKKTGVPAGVRCGGSIITKKHVVTAAHCILNREFQLTNIRLGEWDLRDDPDCVELPAQTECADKIVKVDVKEEIAHPYYTRAGNNDIAVLKLATEITYTDYIRPICLPPRNLPLAAFNTLMTVAGWGLTENMTTSDIKLKVEVPLLAIDKCLETLQRKALGVNQLCAGGERGRDSCTGDSGGPLMRQFEDPITKQTNWYQEGVVSLGLGCARQGFPAVYTRIDRYINWILNIVEEDEN